LKGLRYFYGSLREYPIRRAVFKLAKLVGLTMRFGGRAVVSRARLVGRVVYDRTHQLTIAISPGDEHMTWYAARPAGDRIGFANPQQESFGRTVQNVISEELVFHVYQSCVN
jgi:hypothetical protein